MGHGQLSEEEIFDAAFKLESLDARRDYLKQACRDEEQVDRILTLLKEGAPDASFLERGPWQSTDADSVSDDVPRTIGDFEILGELGRGGMGVVYRARQRSLNRLVALKVLSVGFGLTTKAIMRFKREAEAAAKLHHTNIVPIYWTGDENRIPYYAMELIDGPSMDRVIRQFHTEAGSAVGASRCTTDVATSGSCVSIPDWVTQSVGFQPPPSVNQTSTSFDSSTSLSTGSSYYDDVASKMAGVADALAHAHDHGVIHRDIKPANLLLSSEGQLSINDFGLARILEQPGLTVTGEFMGSPMYMSPEQIAAGRLPIDHRTDIYSLGASLYEVLTLQPPFPGNQRDQVLSQIAHKEPLRPRSINPRIPKDLETICLKAMEKDPDRRYQTADQMAVDLRHFVDRLAISARRIGALERAGRWARKNKALTAMACLTLIVGMAASLFVHRERVKRLEEADRVRVKQLEEAKGYALLAAFGPDSVEALKKIERARTLGAQPAWASMLIGQVDLFEGRSQKAIVNLKVAADEQPNSVMAQSMLTAAHLANGDFGAYANTLERLDSMSPNSAEDHLFKGWAIRMFTPDRAMEEMNQAFKTPRTFTLAHVLRAHTRTIQAQHQSDLSLLDSAISELDTVSLDLEENALLSNYY